MFIGGALCFGSNVQSCNRSSRLRNRFRQLLPVTGWTTGTDVLWPTKSCGGRSCPCLLMVDIGQKVAPGYIYLRGALCSIICTTWGWISLPVTELSAWTLNRMPLPLSCSAIQVPELPPDGGALVMKAGRATV